MKTPKWLIFSIIIFSFIGFIDASYLTVTHYTGAGVTCHILKGCDVVTTSRYSQIFGIPLALLGLFYYLTVLISSLLYLDTKNEKIIQFIQPLTVVGFIASGYFVYVMFIVIKALCDYCILSAITSTILFFLGILTIKSAKS